MRTIGEFESQPRKYVKEIRCDWCKKLYYHNARDYDVDTSYGEVHNLKVEYSRGVIPFETVKRYRNYTYVTFQWADLCKKCRPKLFTLMKKAGIRIQKRIIKDEYYVNHPHNVN